MRSPSGVCGQSDRGASSSANIEHPAVGVDIAHRKGISTWSLEPTFEYAVYCAVGAATINGSPVTEGQLLQWEPETAELTIHTDDTARLILLGGSPWKEPLFMWWNFVARSKSEVAQAISDWSAWSAAGEHERFAPLRSTLAAIPAPALP